MPRAVWKDTVLADSNETRIVEGNHYFPSNSIKQEHFRSSTAHSVCPHDRLCVSCCQRPAAEQAVGDVQHVVRLVVGQMSLEQPNVLVDPAD